MIGIIHSIIWLVWRCRGSDVGFVVIFCCRNIDPPTRTGNAKFHGTAAAETRSMREIPRNWLLNGTAEIAGFQL